MIVPLASRKPHKYVDFWMTINQHHNITTINGDVHNGTHHFKGFTASLKWARLSAVAGLGPILWMAIYVITTRLTEILLVYSRPYIYKLLSSTLYSWKVEVDLQLQNRSHIFRASFSRHSVSFFWVFLLVFLHYVVVFVWMGVSYNYMNEIIIFKFTYRWVNDERSELLYFAHTRNVIL